MAPVDVLATAARVVALDPLAVEAMGVEDRTRLLGRLRDIDALIAALHGEANRTLAALSPRKARTVRAEDAVVDEVCAARRVGSWTAARMLATARLTATPDAPGAPVQAALLAGATSAVHVDRLVAATGSVVDDVLSPDEVAAGVVGRSRAEKLAEIVAGTMRSARMDTPAQYRATVDAAVARVDGPAVVERRRAALHRRDVLVHPDSDGLGVLVWRDEYALLRRAADAIQVRARRVQRERGGAAAARTCPDARVGACRADVLADLVLTPTAGDPVTDAPGPLPADSTIPGLPADTGAAARHPVREGWIVIDLDTLRGEAEHPALLDGTPVPAAIGRAAAARVRRWRRMVTDPVTGHLLDFGRSVYLPSELTDFVRARDGRCLVPFCDRPARRCQVDHGCAYPEGPSSSVNCGLLCDRHHPLKTDGYEHLIIDEATGWVTYRTAWGQTLDATGHTFLPDWDDEPYAPGPPEPQRAAPAPPPVAAPPPKDDPPPF